KIFIAASLGGISLKRLALSSFYLYGRTKREAKAVKRSKALPGPIRAGDPTDPPPGFDWLIHFSLEFVAWGIGVNIGVNVIHSLVYSSVLRVRIPLLATMSKWTPGMGASNGGGRRPPRTGERVLLGLGVASLPAGEVQPAPYIQSRGYMVRGYATGKERPSSNVELTVKADASKPISDIQEPVQSLTQTLKASP
ncbi:7998_t:CDS:2, partial [Dentiscutata heterogama]